MLVLFARAAVLYVALILIVRGMGKRQLGQFQPYELVVTMLIANLASTPMSDLDTPLWQGILPPAALLLLHGAMTLLSMRSDRMRAILSGRPTLIVSGGVFNEKEMRNLCLTLADALEGLRACGLLDPAEVGTAVMEANGAITAFPRSDCRPATAAEAGIQTAVENLPMVLVMDGRIQNRNLQSLRQTEEWLKAVLAEHSLAPGGVFLCSVDGQGIMTVQDRGGRVLRFPVTAAACGG